MSSMSAVHFTSLITGKNFFHKQMAVSSLNSLWSPSNHSISHPVWLEDTDKKKFLR
jgi:hypothetical protein